VAIDGKVLRRSFDRPAASRRCIWFRPGLPTATGAGADRHRCQVERITAVPKLLKLLTLQGSIVTADALNCQRAIAEQIVEQQGDYALALKQIKARCTKM